MVDILSFPIISAVISSLDMTPNDHIEYHRGSESPASFSNVEHDRLQFRCFEFVYNLKGNGTSTPPSSAESSPIQRKRKSTTTLPSIVGASKYERFQKEMIWCIFKNYRYLSHVGDTENRYCYIDPRHNIALATTNNDNIPTIYATSTQVVGTLKIFSNSSQIFYIKSLNYRNMLNLYNHIIVYFDVAKYYRRNSENIFGVHCDLLVQNIDRSMNIDYIINNNNNNNNNAAERLEVDAYKNLRAIETLLGEETFSD